MAELGGSVITGIDGNPLAVLARQLRIPMYALKNGEEEEAPIYMDDGTPADPVLDARARPRARAPALAAPRH